MTLTVEAIYENGVLKPDQPLPLKEHEKVTITVHSGSTWVERTAGLIGWKGDAETLQRIALDPEFSVLEAYDHAELERCVEALRKARSQSPLP